MDELRSFLNDIDYGCLRLCLVLHFMSSSTLPFCSTERRKKLMIILRMCSIISCDKCRLTLNVTQFICSMFGFLSAPKFIITINCDGFLIKWMHNNDNVIEKKKKNISILSIHRNAFSMKISLSKEKIPSRQSIRLDFFTVLSVSYCDDDAHRKQKKCVSQFENPFTETFQQQSETIEKCQDDPISFIPVFIVHRLLLGIIVENERKNFSSFLCYILEHAIYKTWE